MFEVRKMSAPTEFSELVLSLVRTLGSASTGAIMMGDLTAEAVRVEAEPKLVLADATGRLQVAYKILAAVQAVCSEDETRTWFLGGEPSPFELVVQNQLDRALQLADDFMSNG
jgi:hypothetical protein